MGLAVFDALAGEAQIIAVEGSQKGAELLSAQISATIIPAQIKSCCHTEPS